MATERCKVQGCEKPVNKDGLCLLHKLRTVSVGTVPGGAKDQSNGFSRLRQREADLDRYAAKRKVGERPDGTSKAAMDKYERRVRSWERAESRFRDELPPESVKSLEHSTFNKVKERDA